MPFSRLPSWDTGPPPIVPLNPKVAPSPSWGYRHDSVQRVQIRDDIRHAMNVNILLSLLSTSNYANDTPEVDALKKMFRDAKPRYTCGILSSGGCGDSIAAVLSGFKILWGTEIDEGKRALFRDLTGAIDMGNTFDADLHECQRPQVIISGQPCTDYSTSGSRTGEGGATGWQYTQQTDLINKIRPRAFVLDSCWCARIPT